MPAVGVWGCYPGDRVLARSVAHVQAISMTFYVFQACVDNIPHRLFPRNKDVQWTPTELWNHEYRLPLFIPFHLLVQTIIFPAKMPKRPGGIPHHTPISDNSIYYPI